MYLHDTSEFESDHIPFQLAIISQSPLLPTCLGALYQQALLCARSNPVCLGGEGVLRLVPEDDDQYCFGTLVAPEMIAADLPQIGQD